LYLFINGKKYENSKFVLLDWILFLLSFNFIFFNKNRMDFYYITNVIFIYFSVFKNSL